MVRYLVWAVAVLFAIAGAQSALGMITRALHGEPSLDLGIINLLPAYGLVRRNDAARAYSVFVGWAFIAAAATLLVLAVAYSIFPAFRVWAGGDQITLLQALRYVAPLAIVGLFLRWFFTRPGTREYFVVHA